MGRARHLEDNEVISVRVEKRSYDNLREIAALESLNTGRYISVNELIRDAIDFVYTDNDRMRESFRRSRLTNSKRYQ